MKKTLKEVLSEKDENKIVTVLVDKKRIAHDVAGQLRLHDEKTLLRWVKEDNVELDIIVVED